MRVNAQSRVPVRGWRGWQRLAGAALSLCLSVSYADDAPRIERHGDLLCLSPAAVVASERDRDALKRQLTEAQTVAVVPVVVAGALRIVVGVGVMLAVNAARRP